MKTLTIVSLTVVVVACGPSPARKSAPAEPIADGATAAEYAERWQQTKPQTYNYHYEPFGFAPMICAVEITVTNGEATDAALVDPSCSRAWAFTRENYLFTLDALIDAAPSAAKVTYDATYGYPTFAHFDYGSEYQEYHVRQFVPAD